MKKDRRKSKFNKVNKPSTNKSLDKLTYCPAKHKQKFVRKLRQQLQKTAYRRPNSSPEVVDFLKFGSWNVGGLDPGTHEALENIILSEELHVSEDVKYISTYVYSRQNLLNFHFTEIFTNAVFPLCLN